MRTVVGQDLQKLFAVHEAGSISQAVFEQRKSALLAWSKGRWMLITPRKLRVRGISADERGPPLMRLPAKAIPDACAGP